MVVEPNGQVQREHAAAVGRAALVLGFDDVAEEFRERRAVQRVGADVGARALGEFRQLFNRKNS